MKMIKRQPNTLSIALKNKHSKFNFNFSEIILTSLILCYPFKSIYYQMNTQILFAISFLCPRNYVLT